MNYSSKLNQASRNHVNAAKKQIHSGSILAGFALGTIFSIALIIATSKSSLSAKVHNAELFSKSDSTVAESDRTVII